MFLMQLHRWGGGGGGKLPDSRQGNFCEAACPTESKVPALLAQQNPVLDVPPRRPPSQATPKDSLEFVVVRCWG